MADVLKLQTLDGMLDYPSAEDTSKGTTEQQFQEYLKNHQSVMSDIVAVTLWQPSTAYAKGQVIYSPNMPANTCARVATAGTTGSAEPAWGAVGSTTSDGTAAYTMMYRTVDFATNDVAKAGTDAMTIVTPAALAAVLAAFKTQVISDAHPIGEVWETTTDDDPNKLWPGTTWVKMDPGRVLVSSGDYTENGTTYTYNLGDTGGEAKHQLSKDELARHSHDGVISTSGDHFHKDGRETLYADYGGGKYIGGRSVDGGSSRQYRNANTSTDGEHSHTLSIQPIGENLKHENRQPYQVIIRWRRTA